MCDGDRKRDETGAGELLYHNISERQTRRIEHVRQKREQQCAFRPSFALRMMFRRNRIDNSSKSSNKCEMSAFSKMQNTGHAIKDEQKSAKFVTICNNS